jgi:hypothetical protein
MATHDYVLANQSGSSFRSDLNNALAAIVSQNSSASEPATKYAYQYWVDTSVTPALIKQRNAANDGWITLSEVGGQLLAADGTAAKPGISFAADVNTGLKRNAADEIGLVTGGVERITVQSDGDTGIGTTTPGAKVHIQQSAVTSAPARATALYLENNANCEVQMVGNSSNDCQIRFGTSSNSFKGALEYQLDVDALLAYTSGVERMRINSSGRVGIGTTSPQSALAVRGSTPRITFEPAADTQNCRLQFATTNGTVKTSIQAGGSDGTDMRFVNNDTSSANLVLKGSGNVGIGTTSPSSKLTVIGSISKSSGSFKIDHPLPELSETHHLVHSFVEAPDASNLYAGMVDLVEGTATVNIDTAHRMTVGTFEALNTLQSWSSSNESGYAPVKCSVSGNLLTIECQDATSTDTVYYEVRGVRKDQHMIDTEWTDSNGLVIVEPKKFVEAEEIVESEE